MSRPREIETGPVETGPSKNEDDWYVREVLKGEPIDEKKEKENIKKAKKAIEELGLGPSRQIGINWHKKK